MCCAATTQRAARPQSGQRSNLGDRQQLLLRDFPGSSCALQPGVRAVLWTLHGVHECKARGEHDGVDRRRCTCLVCLIGTATNETAQHLFPRAERLTSLGQHDKTKLYIAGLSLVYAEVRARWVWAEVAMYIVKGRKASLSERSWVPQILTALRSRSERPAEAGVTS